MRRQHVEAGSQFFPCERPLGVGEPAVIAGDTIYCPVCYDYAETRWPELANVARRFQLKRGVTCGGGYAED